MEVPLKQLDFHEPEITESMIAAQASGTGMKYQLS